MNRAQEKVSSSLSILTFSWAVILILASFRARQLLSTIQSKIGAGNISLIIWGVFIAFLWVLLRQLPKNKSLLSQMMLVFIPGFLYALTFEIPEERIHLVKYGILGWLAARDSYGLHGIKAVLVSLLVGTAVAITDETVQFTLPYRVGDPRDVLFGAIGSLWGGMLFLASRHSIKNSKPLS